MKTSIYLPDDLAQQVRTHRISISQVAQAALREAVQAATNGKDVTADIHAVAELLRGTIDQSEHERRDRGHHDGIRWAKQYATAGELVQLTCLDDRTLVVARPHTLVEFVSATKIGFHQVVKVDSEDSYWDGFQTGAGDVWNAVEFLLRRPRR